MYFIVMNIFYIVSRTTQELYLIKLGCYSSKNYSEGDFKKILHQGMKQELTHLCIKTVSNHWHLKGPAHWPLEKHTQKQICSILTYLLNDHLCNLFIDLLRPSGILVRFVKSITHQQQEAVGKIFMSS